MKPIFTVVVQARLGSSRLPGKVALPLGSSCVLEVMLDRIRKSSWVDQLVVATTELPQDDLVAEITQRAGSLVFRGHETDCLHRHFYAWKKWGGDYIVKIPSDCPLIDPHVIDQVLAFASQLPLGQADYVSNLHPQSYPDGNDVEVMSAQALQRAFEESTRSIDREHTTPYLWDNPDKFRLYNVTTPDGIDYSQAFRWTLDYREDYELIQQTFHALYAQNPFFSWKQIVDFLKATPECYARNAAYRGDSWYQRHASELRHPIQSKVSSLELPQGSKNRSSLE